MNNTLLDRCARAYEDAILSQYSHERAITAVLDHVAAEIIVLSQRNKAMTAFQCAQLLIDASKKTTQA